MVRFEIGITKINQKAYEDFYVSAVHYTSNADVKQNILRCVPAVQWNYFRKKFFETYSGLSITYLRYGSYSYNIYSENRDSITNDLQSWAKEIKSIDGGYAGGVGFFAGINFYLQKHLSFGVEFTSAFLYYRVGGDRIVEDSSQVLPNPASSTQFNWKYNYNSLRFANILSTFNITLSF